MKKNLRIWLIIFGILIVFGVLFLIYYSSDSYAIKQAKEATIYLEDYYLMNERYPSPQEFYENFNKKLKYGLWDLKHYVLEYKVRKAHPDAIGTLYSFSQLFTSELRYYSSSCDFARRCSRIDFRARFSEKNEEFIIHDKTTLYDFVAATSLQFPLYKNDPYLKNILLYNTTKIKFVEADKGETRIYRNIDYNKSFYTLQFEANVTPETYGEEITYTQLSLFPTGKNGFTSVSYDVAFCSNVTILDCESSVRVTMPLEIYSRF